MISVAAVSPGSTSLLPKLTQTSIPSLVAFGAGAQTLPVISGSPTSYVPPPLPTSATVSSPVSSSQISIAGGRVRVSKKVILGVSLGLGIPAIAVTCCWLVHGSFSRSVWFYKLQAACLTCYSSSAGYCYSEGNDAARAIK
jgi:hypothetical protein